MVGDDAGHGEEAMTIIDKAKRAGLILPANRGLSAKAIRANDPAFADRFAQFIDDNRSELVEAVAGALHARDRQP